MNAKKNLPPPPTDIGVAMRRRYTRDSGAARSENAARSESSARSGRRDTARTAEMDRRSWYMPRESADALAQLVDDLHYATRRPKHEVLAAVIAVALAHRSEIENRL